MFPTQIEGLNVNKDLTSMFITSRHVTSCDGDGDVMSDPKTTCVVGGESNNFNVVHPLVNNLFDCYFIVDMNINYKIVVNTVLDCRRKRNQ